MNKNKLHLAISQVEIPRIPRSTNLGREELFELDKKGPYNRYLQFPVEVPCEIEIPQESDINWNKILFWFYGNYFQPGSGNISKTTEYTVKEDKPKVCQCDTLDLMKHGCKCGGI